MFNTEKPSLEELPSSSQLIRSTIIAIMAAVAILVTIILPAEYGIDPTGAGRLLGLTEMGEIKKELSNEAEQDHQSSLSSQRSAPILSGLKALFIGTAHAQSTEVWKDSITFDLNPGDTHEFKLAMTTGDIVRYQMTVDGGRVNFDLHAHGGGNAITYEKGRGSKGSEGQFEAAFDGNHGWFWRNRDNKRLKVTLKLSGAYALIE